MKQETKEWLRIAAEEVASAELLFGHSIYRSRYPPEAGLLPCGEPTKEDAEKALALARRVVAEGKDILGNNA